MAADSRFVREIMEAFDQLPATEQRRMTSIYGLADRVVHYARAHVPGATNLCIAPSEHHATLRDKLSGAVFHHGQTGHSRMPQHPLVRQLIDAVIAGQEPALV